MAEEGGNGVNSETSKLGRIGLSSQSRWFLFFKCALLVWLVLFLVDLLMLYVQPRLYLGRVRLQIMPLSKSFEVFRDNSTQAMITPTFIQTEFQVITSKETLYDVIEELQLVKKWEDAKSPADAYALLLDKLETEEVPGTDMIDIEIFHTDPEEAAQLANAVGNAYKNRRIQLETNRASQTLDTLNAQETLQEQKVEDTRQRMIELMEKFNIVDLSDPAEPSSDSPKTSTGSALADAVAAFHEKKRAAVAIQTQVATIRELDDELKAQWMLKADLLPEAAKNACDESAQLEGEYALLLASGMASDAELLNLRKTIEAKQGVFLKATADAMRLLEVEEKIATSITESFARLHNDLKDTMMDERKQYTQYQEAKNEYMMQREILEDMRRALLKEKVDVSLPRQPIVIHEIAEANEVPAFPRVPLALAGNAAFNLLWCIPGGLIVMYFAMLYSARQQRLAVYPDQIADAIELDADEVASNAPPYSKGEDNW
ncbi:MAG: hypothetical protein KDN22_20295 [Verrucomicrobiae bacterium]|nr:hypothetical protein [Verrucomicrobiae bacterium]